jgi:uncharacterized protein (DUF1778 family)
VPATARKKRTERINVRVSNKEAELIRLGAEHRGVNITNFILESACVRAEQEIADARHFELSTRGWKQFIEALDRPAAIKPRLKKLLNERTVLEQN